MEVSAQALTLEHSRLMLDVSPKGVEECRNLLATSKRPRMDWEINEQKAA
jgi:hypothetical protein